MRTTNVLFIVVSAIEMIKTHKCFVNVSRHRETRLILTQKIGE